MFDEILKWWCYEWFFVLPSCWSLKRDFFCMFALNWLSTLLSHFPLVLFWHFSIRVEEELHRCHKLKNTDERNLCAGWFFELPSPPNDELFHTLQFCHFHNDSVLLRRSENKGSLESKLFHAFFLHSTNCVLRTLNAVQVTKVCLKRGAYARYAVKTKDFETQENKANFNKEQNKLEANKKLSLSWILNSTTWTQKSCKLFELSKTRKRPLPGFHCSSSFFVRSFWKAGISPTERKHEMQSLRTGIFCSSIFH